MAGALKRVAGNQRLYRELLMRFAADQGELQIEDPSRNQERRPEAGRESSGTP